MTVAPAFGLIGTIFLLAIISYILCVFVAVKLLQRLNFLNNLSKPARILFLIIGSLILAVLLAFIAHAVGYSISYVIMQIVRLFTSAGSEISRELSDIFLLIVILMPVFVSLLSLRYVRRRFNKKKIELPSV